jgi:hypothetical protein
MINLSQTPAMNLLLDQTKKILLPELSSTYCYAILKAKAKEKYLKD